MAVPVGMAAEVDDDRGGQQDDIILALSDVDTVGVRPGEIALGNISDRPDSGARECVFVVGEIPFGVITIGAGHIYIKSTSEERNELLVVAEG